MKMLMEMDAKDLRIEPALSERSSDASKYAQSGTSLQSNRNKSYQDIGSNPSAKVDAPNARPCAVIGPDRVVPPTDPNDTYLKKAPDEPWPCSDTVYHRPPEYPHKFAAYHNPTRNISPRQTFQENMQRIMVAPTYNSVKVNDNASFIQKLNMTSDAKYCDVPYSVNPTTNDPKNMRSVEMCLPNVNSALGRPAPHGWPPGGINVRPQRQYVPSDMYQFPEYPSCAGPRPVTISRPHRTVPEESGYMYPEPYYQEPNIRFKPYPNVKERYPQQRYDYVTNYSNPFHPPPCPPQKYETPKSLPPHPYPGYPHFKYLDSRMPEPMLEGYQRPVGQQGSYNIPYRNQIVHPAYGPVMNNNSQSKIPPYPPDGSFKAATSNKLPYDGNGKIYVEYDNARMKPFAPTENFYPNENSRHHAVLKGAMPNYPSINVQPVPTHSYYKKDNPQFKNYEYVNHFKNLNPLTNMNSPLQRHMPQFSPNGLAISPNDSNISNDTSPILNTSQEDFGYVNQSSITSIRSIDLGNSKIPNEYYARYYDPRYGPVIRSTPKSNRINNTDNKTKKDMDVRKFLQMWNEGDDDNPENGASKEIVIQANSNDLSNTLKPHGVVNNQEQLYVLGLVNVPSEELSKYEHIQKVSKLPENIKGYNSIELLNQFEEVIESSNMNNFKLSTSKEFQATMKPSGPKQTIGLLPRPLSPLDVEAKISQSVIHKDVGCNFEIKPCSPKMLNVEIASPVQNILNERVIEKVTNPLSMITSPILNGIDDSIEHCNIQNFKKDQRILDENEKISSCKMINIQYSNTDTNLIKTNYSIQDLESNAGVCLASLPRLDNDIELNFPEVNQQFINANKGEPDITTEIKNLPELNGLDQTDKILNDIKPENSCTNVLSPKVEIEREFTKLSKYRKIKTNVSDSVLDKFAVKAIRTDSVIIKNPENIKSLGIDKEQPPINKIRESSPQISIDVTSRVDSVVEIIHESTLQNETDANDVAHTSSEVAIDFRLHKDSGEPFEMNDNIIKTCEPLHLSKEEKILSKINQCINTNEVTKSPEKNKEDIKTIMFTKEISSDISSTEKDIENYTVVYEVPPIFESTPYVTAPETDKTCVSDTIIKNIGENEIIELQLSNEDSNKTTEFNINNKESSDQLPIKNNVNSAVDIEIKSQINKIVTCDESYGQLNVIQPKEGDIKISVSVDTPISEVSLDKNDVKILNEEILPNKFANESFTPQVNDKRNNDYDHKEKVNTSSEKIYEQLVPKEEYISHTDSVELCHSNHNSELTDMSSVDEGFVSIDEKQNCDQTAVSNYLDNDVDSKKITDIFEKSNDPMRYFNTCSGYGSKELYSPWIQKLLMYEEGICCAFYSDENKLSPVRIDNSIMVTRLADIDSESCFNTNGSRTENSEALDCGSVCNDAISDGTLHSKHDMHIKANVVLFSTDCEKLDTQITSKDQLVNIQNSSMNNDKTGKELDLNEDAKGETIKLMLDDLDENECIDRIFEPRTNVSNKVEEDYAGELDIAKQLKNTHEEYALNKYENEYKMASAISKQIPTKHSLSLKRSLSDSALNVLHHESQAERDDNSVVWPLKRSKLVDTKNVNESDSIAQNLCNILQNNRRNSISAVYNEENVSFCILIEDNTMLTEENEEAEKVTYSELAEDCLNEINNTYICDENNVNVTNDNVACDEERNCEYSDSITLNGEHDISLDEAWIEDVACVETVVSDDIAEDIVISSASIPKDNDFWDNEELNNYENSDREYDPVIGSPKYDDGASHNDPQFLKQCETPQMDVYGSFIPRKSQGADALNGLYDTESLEKILSESNSQLESPCNITESLFPCESSKSNETPDGKENINIGILAELDTKGKRFNAVNDLESKIELERTSSKSYEKMQDGMVHSCESSIDNVFSYKNRDDSTNYATSSSPEVSSTTPEEKGSSIMLKITNYKGSKISQINTFNPNNNNRISCKFTEKTDYVNTNAKLTPNRPLITKAAQKYIPPIKESIRDLKVKLSLPQHSLLKLKQIKTPKDEPKLNKQRSTPSILPKKPKPKFEDVLKSIDEIQIKMHKEKNKKVKKSIPKVVIKKSENGSHYASTSNKDTFNPDLTGRKWQPWVFLEKSNFIDKMATRRKTKAIFSHRKNAYVLAEKFHKYKSVSSTKFIISQPKLSGSSTGQLKYTIRLKHSY